MKKAISILFIAIALVFCVKDIVVLIDSMDESVTYILDMNEEEESEKGEKNKMNEKAGLEDWQLTDADVMVLQNEMIDVSFHTHKVKKHFTPYFEIHSPPPEHS